MATDVDICNLALGYLGDRGTVTSIDPPEGSIQAGHCQRFYPLARDTALQERVFSFSIRRDTPAGIEVETGPWRFEYVLPNNLLTFIGVLPSATPALVLDSLLYPGAIISQIKANEQLEFQPCNIEAADDGTPIIYTDQEDAIIIYSIRVTNTNRFSPLFVNALSRLLASYLAGPIIKGDAGRAESQAQLKLYEYVFSKASEQDANQSTGYAMRDYVPSNIKARM